MGDKVNTLGSLCTGVAGRSLSRRGIGCTYVVCGNAGYCMVACADPEQRLASCIILLQNKVPSATPFRRRFLHFPMLPGYAQVSPDEQGAAAQRRVLLAAGCQRILEETASGGRWNRPQLQELLGQIRKDDVSRRASRTCYTMEHPGEAGAESRSLADSIDTQPLSKEIIRLIGDPPMRRGNREAGGTPQAHNRGCAGRYNAKAAPSK